MRATVTTPVAAAKRPPSPAKGRDCDGARSAGPHCGLAHRALAANNGPQVRQLMQLQRSVAAVGTPIAASPLSSRGLPSRLRAGIEALSGVSMAGVEVHRDSPKPASIGALAYAQGNQIHLGLGAGAHLPHEAWHVVQQAQGRVAPLRRLDDVAINDDGELEREADVMGARAAAGTALSAGIGVGEAPSGAPPDGGPVQCRMGLELEFTLPVDGLGVLSNEQKSCCAVRTAILNARNCSVAPLWTRTPPSSQAQGSSSGQITGRCEA